MKDKRPLGMIFTVAVSLVFVIAIIGWLNLYKTPKTSVKQIKENEIATYTHLKEIAAAQEKYVMEDWDADGEYEYSIFLVHLWKTVISKNGNTRLLELIPKKLSFATESSTALDGYIYMVLHYYNSPKGILTPIDHTNEWAVYAGPNVNRRSGHLHFIIDHTGRVLASETQMIYDHDYPYDPLQNDWKVVESIKDLREIQNNVSYLIQQ